MKSIISRTRVKGSVLVFSLIILSLMLVTSLSLMASSVSQEKAALATGDSTHSFQIADTGVEQVLYQLYQQNPTTLQDVATKLGLPCANGAITNATVGWTVRFLDVNGNRLSAANCTDASNLVSSIRSEGTANGTTRAVAVDVTPQDGAVGWWKLDDGAGTTATDSSGKGNDATLSNFASPATATSGWTSGGGKRAGALVFDGVDDSIRSGSGYAKSLGTNDLPYTVSAWVNVASGKTGNGNIVHIAENSGGTGWCISPLNISGGKFRATSWDGTEVDAVGTTSVQSGTWYYVVTTWSVSTGLNLYVNGTLEATTKHTIPSIQPSPKYVASGKDDYVFAGFSPGSCSGNTGFFTGTIDDVRVYDYARSQAQITKEYNDFK
ncbi:MAG: LamG-like jellyroll fold domain-containing protein [Candidatus Moraniibacteriota bacterium]